MSQLIYTASEDFQQDIFPTFLILKVNSVTQCVFIPTYINDDGPSTFSEAFLVELLPQEPFQVPITANSVTTQLPQQLSVVVTIVEQCRPGDITLLDGGWVGQGRVEVCYHGVFNTVCTSGWTLQNTRVVCMQLGYYSGLGKLINVKPVNYLAH